MQRLVVVRYQQSKVHTSHTKHPEEMAACLQVLVAMLELEGDLSKGRWATTRVVRPIKEILVTTRVVRPIKETRATTAALPIRVLVMRAALEIRGTPLATITTMLDTIMPQVCQAKRSSNAMVSDFENSKKSCLYWHMSEDVDSNLKGPATPTHTILDLLGSLTAKFSNLWSEEKAQTRACLTYLGKRLI